MKLVIIIPAYNEGKVIGAVLKTLPKKIKNIDEIVTIVVDDGSTDDTFVVSRKYADQVISLAINMGVGAATITGLEAAKKLKADLVVTMDGDGQHNPGDIRKLIEPILRHQADVVNGTRMKDSRGMPMVKIIGNWVMNLLTFLVFRKWSSDSQSGMKAFSDKALKKMNLHSVGYEICSEIIGETKRNQLTFLEVPIKVHYSEYSKAKGQEILNGINILTRTIMIKLGGKQ